jgi:hypothetical protein
VASQICLASTKPRFDQNYLVETCITYLLCATNTSVTHQSLTVISRIRHRVVDHSLAAVLHQRDLHLSEDVGGGAYKSPPCRVGDKSEGRSR